MGELHDLEASSGLIQPKVGLQDTNLWSEEHDRLPLKQRLKILLARSKLSELFPDSGSENDEISNFPKTANDNSARKDDELYDRKCIPVACSHLEGKPGNSPSEQNHIGELRDCHDTVIKVNVVSPSIDPVKKVKGMDDSSCSHSMVSSDSAVMENLGAGNSSSSLVTNYPHGGDLQKKEAEILKPTNFVDEFDHIVLKERQRLLLSSQTLRLTKTSLEGKTGLLPAPAMTNLSPQSSKNIKEESSYDDKEFQSVENHVCGNQKTSGFGSSKAAISSLPNSHYKSSCLGDHRHESISLKPRNMTKIEEKDRACSLSINFTPYGTGSGQNSLHNKSIVADLTISTNVKVEPQDINETSIPEVPVTPLPVEDMNPLKSECDSPNDLDEDILDHMLLRERMKLRRSYGKHGMESIDKIVPSAALDCEPSAKESPKPLRINRTRKRRKTATDCIETALEEDAPGLLQVLIQKGVAVDEIKLYGQPENDDALDDLPTEDDFMELETIISKIFSQRSSLLKLSSLRHIKGEKASYCLACLFSLVEQARYLRFRKWPVEWGWCRDLQAFIFVFERHNRIVLERPEYGFATYFFELTNSLPINWQIKRLVTAMKLSNYSRVTLIENKGLVVGEDLTEGEAKVLREYGWIPNTGLGTMLNYCDRVVHDRNHEDPSEWRSKIGKMLVDGYNGGCIVSTDVRKKVAECNFSEIPGIKLESN